MLKQLSVTLFHSNNIVITFLQTEQYTTQHITVFTNLFSGEEYVKAVKNRWSIFSKSVLKMATAKPRVWARNGTITTPMSSTC